MAVLSVPAPSMRFYGLLWVSIFPHESFQNLPRFSFLGNPGLFHVLPWYSMRFYGIPWLSPIFPLLLSTFPHIYLLFPTYSFFFPIISCVFPMFPWYYSHRTLCFMLEIMLKLLNSISMCDTGQWPSLAKTGGWIIGCWRLVAVGSVLSEERSKWVDGIYPCTQNPFILIIISQSHLSLLSDLYSANPLVDPKSPHWYQCYCIVPLSWFSQPPMLMNLCSMFRPVFVTITSYYTFVS